MTHRPFRYDSGEMKKAMITPQGYLKADAFATRSGIFLYRKPDGSVQRELRPAAEVFHPDSLQSLAEVPVTNDHPQMPLNVENTKLLAVGYTGSEIAKLGDFVKCGITIYDKATIEGVMQGSKKELSGGYTCDIEMTPGMYKGMQYDAIQTNIRYNHLAVVKDGRAGHEASIKLDSQDAVMVEEDAKKESENDQEEKKDSAKEKNQVISTKEIEKGESIMPKLKIDSVEYELPEAVASFISKSDAILSEVKKQNDQLQAKFDAMEALKKKEDAKKSTAEEPEDEDEEEMEDGKKKDKSKKMDRKDAIVYGRDFAEAESFAHKVIGKEFKADTLDLIDVKRAVCAKAMPEIKLDGKSEDYVNAMFDSFKSQYKDPEAKKLQNSIGAIKTDSVVDVKQARFDSMTRMENRWQVPFDKLSYSAPAK
jgi:hypothetical protein